MWVCGVGRGVTQLFINENALTITTAPCHFCVKINDCITRSGSTISFRIASLLMRATRCEKRHVEIDSWRRLKEKRSSVCFLFQNFWIWQWLFWQCHLTSRFLLSTAIVAIIVVMQFPPRLSLRTDVNKEFLYGMWGRFVSSAMIT